MRSSVVGSGVCFRDGLPGAILTFAFYSPMLCPHGPPKAERSMLIAASIIAVIRLRGEPIKPSPKLSAVVADSVELARFILRQIEGRAV